MVMADGTPMSMDDSGFNTHVFGMWLDFLLSAALITFFVSRMSRALREQDRRLAEQHERLLQKEQVVALGALAAGAAHELGTPLATMTVLAQDLEADLPEGSALRADVGTLREQLAVCRRILGSLREQAMNPEAVRPQSLREFGGALLSKMDIIHPARQFSLLAGEGADVIIQPTPLFEQVVVNLLNNAAEASRAQVTMALAVQGQEFMLDIHDDGPGIDPGVAERLGQPFVSSKPDGLGLGFFLSHASINQLGGSIHLQDAPGGGTNAALRLPLASLGVRS
jgi:two-component system sensor histidine kinase RegB